MNNNFSQLEAIDGQKAFSELVDHFLGKNWYVVDPLSQTQVNAIALEEIKSKYPKKKKFVFKRVYFDE